MMNKIHNKIKIEKTDDIVSRARRPTKLYDNAVSFSGSWKLPVLSGLGQIDVWHQGSWPTELIVLMQLIKQPVFTQGQDEALEEYLKYIAK